MNAHGGTLLIGVNDSREAVGLANDYKLTGGKPGRDPRDSFENWLTGLMDTSIGRPPLANMVITFEEVDGHDVCRVEVTPTKNPYTQRVNRPKTSTCGSTTAPAPSTSKMPSTTSQPTIGIVGKFVGLGQ
jgi:hypothetical protein